MRLSVLETEGVQRIDEAARRILDRTGVEVPHDETLQALPEGRRGRGRLNLPRSHPFDPGG